MTSDPARPGCSGRTSKTPGGAEVTYRSAGHNSSEIDSFPADDRFPQVTAQCGWVGL